MRVAILHDTMTFAGGGQRVALQLGRVLDAPVFTARLDPAVVDEMGYAGADVRVLPPGPVPQARFSALDNVRLLARYLGVRNLPGGPYDAYVLSGSVALFAAWRLRPALEYCYAPNRALYDLHDELLKACRSTPHWLFSRLFHAGWRVLDRLSHRRAGRMVAISDNTARRARRYLDQEPHAVVRPPLEPGGLRFLESGDFWLSVNRLSLEKRIGLQLETFRRLPDLRLKIVGTGPAMPSPEECPPNVEFLGRLPQPEIDVLYGRCQGFLTTALDEDFGLTPLEAMAAGKPVVAVDEGGYRETVTPATGRLVPADPDALAAAVRQVAQDPLSFREACEARAREFSLEAFGAAMRAQMEALVRSAG